MNAPNPEQESINSMFEKLSALTTANLEVGPIDGFLIVSYIQIALRHPLAEGAAARRIKQIARTVQAALASRVPEVGELLEKGWVETNEVPRAVLEENPLDNFASLSIDRQREIAVNITALGLIADYLSSLVSLPSEAIMADALRKADEMVKQLSDEEVLGQSQALDQEYHEFNFTDETHDHN